MAKTMESMFYGCIKLKELDLIGFKINDKTNIEEIFKCCHKLEIKNTEDVRLISEYGMIGGKIDGKIKTI